jgi:hypothetical protein
MESLSFQYPTYYLIFCALLGLAYALTLYYKDDSFKESSTNWNAILGILRFLSVTLLSILLLSPLLKSLLTETKKPVVVVAQDLSESVAAEMDETKRADYQANMEAMTNSLSEKFEVVEYGFGNEVRQGIDYKFDDKVSNLSEMLTEVYDLYSNQNLGAVILATDGIYNEGSNPIYTGTKLSAPIYTIALGDTIPKKDLILKRVFHNKIAYLGDKFSIQVDVAAQNCVDNATSLTISKIENGVARKLSQNPISIDKNDFFTTQEVILDADRAGVQRFRIAVKSVNGEVTTANNVKDIFVDVLDARQKILLLANSPHPDIASLRRTLEKNKNYEVKTGFATDANLKVGDYDFVVLHQLPSQSNDISAILNTLNAKKVPRLFIVGTQTNLSRFNGVQPVMSIQGDGRNTNDVQGTFATDFSLFKLDDDLKQNLPKFAPLLAPFGEFKAEGNAQTLLYQRIGKVETKYPLLVLGEENDTKISVLAGEGIWRWRLFDYLQNQNHDIFGELMSKTFQYATLKEDKRRFRIAMDKNIFKENEAIVFDGELYNESYELINEPDVSLSIKDGDGKEFPFTFNKNTSGYTLNAGILPVGSYTFRGTTFYNGQTLDYNGQFSVQPVQLEVYETTANHGMLRLLSKQFGGELFYPSEVSKLGEAVLVKDTIKPVIYQTTKTRSVINLKWIFFLLLALLSGEWFLRRYHGAY